MLKKRILWTLIVIGTITFLIVTMGSHSSYADQKSTLLEGSWVVRITGGQGTPDLPSWYQANVTFSRGGGLVATITDPLLSTGHGAWSKTGKRDFAVTIIFFQFDPDGNFLGTLKARATLTVNDTSDTFTSDDYQFEFFDPDGNPTGFVGVGEADGTRINVEPLQ